MLQGMKRIGALVAVGAAFGIAASAQASVPTQTITVVNRAGVSAKVLAQVERALVLQANTQLQRWWGTPSITFGAGGWPLILQRHLPDSTCQGAWGCHTTSHVIYVDTSGAPDTSAPAGGWSWIASHEVLEALVDPTGDRYANGDLMEVCDPADDATYKLAGIWVSDFVLPAWWTPAKQGRLDWLGQLRRNGSLRSKQ